MKATDMNVHLNVNITKTTIAKNKKVYKFISWKKIHMEIAWTESCDFFLTGNTKTPQ